MVMIAAYNLYLGGFLPEVSPKNSIHNKRELKNKYKTNKKIILYLFEKYNISEENKKKSNKAFLKTVIEEMKKKKYTKEEKEQLIKEIYNQSEL